MKTSKAGPGLGKTPSGVQGLDEILRGGFPHGRPILVCGNAGAGKTILAMEFLVRGALDQGEPGVFMAFEENERDLTENVASLGFDLKALQRRRKVLVDHVRVERSEIEETGAYNLDGLFVRLDHAVKSIGAKRVVLDTLETLFIGLNPFILRSELRRLFQWLKDRDLTAIITAESGAEGMITRHGIEEYVSDCVIRLDHRVVDQVSTRRLRVLKYRGTAHGTNEYPFLIDELGISVLPITSLDLDHEVSGRRVSSGVPDLDAMLGGKGFYRGSTVLISGTAGSGKTTLAAHFIDGAARRGERCLYYAFEESAGQLERNMASVGIDLARHRKSGRLRVIAARPTTHGLETHLSLMHREIERFKPAAVVIDPLNNLIRAGSPSQVKSMVTRLVDYMKVRGITAVCSSLADADADAGSEGASSLMDTWLLTRNRETKGRRKREVGVLKSRGMPHSNQFQEFMFTKDGVKISPVEAS